MKNNYAAFIIILTGLALISCSNQNDTDEDVDDLTSFRSVERTIDFLEDFDFTAGMIMSLTRVNENEYLFLDFAQRSIFHLDVTENEVRQVGGQGDGPGEYRNPIHFQAIGKDEIAFTDISNMAIKFTHLDGRLIHQIEHGLGGGKQFALYDSEIFILGGLTDPQRSFHQLTVIDRQGDLVKELFPAKKEYENQIRNFGMGGITLIGDRVFLMNSTEPVIYVYNIKTREAEEVTPFDSDDQMFSLNDGVSLMDLDAQELREVYSEGEMVVFQRVGEFKIDGESYLAVSARKGEEYFAYFLDHETLDMQYYYKPSNTIIGFHEDFIYESDIHTSFGIVEEVTFSLENR